MTTNIVPTERITRAILLLRGEKVLLDQDLAGPYGVETRELVRAVKRNVDRFPTDFMFQLSADEFEHLRSHLGISRSWGGRRHRPYAFTEQGVAMLSSVMRSSRAARVNVEIMRAFVQLRRMLRENNESEPGRPRLRVAAERHAITGSENAGNSHHYRG
jgi:hypothetical protein